MKPMTEKSLREAFAGESQAHMKYLIFADLAEKDGKKDIARLFRAIAYAEQVHATNHFRVLGTLNQPVKIFKLAGMARITKSKKCILLLTQSHLCRMRKMQ